METRNPDPKTAPRAIPYRNDVRRRPENRAFGDGARSLVGIAPHQVQRAKRRFFLGAEFPG